jgi:hypothetical protein
MPAPASKAPSPNERRGRRLFLAGALLLIVMGLVHSLSLVKAPVPSNDTERQLLDLMFNYRFNLLGSLRSMQDLMTGYSIAFLLAALGLGAVDLSLRREPAELIQRIAIVNALWLAAMTAVSLRYFFAAPTSFLAAALILFLLAAITLPRTGAGAGPDPR